MTRADSRRNCWHALLLMAACLLPVMPSPAGAAEEVSREDLARAGDRIREAKARVDASRQALSEGQQRLRSAEHAAGELAAGLRQLQARERANTAALASLRQRHDELSARVARQKDALAQDARAAWMLGRQQQLRLWLSADDPQRAARVSRYFGYVQHDRQARLAQYGADLAAQESLAAEVANEQARLAEAREALAQRVQELAEAREERRQAVRALASEVRSREDELRERQQDEAALKHLFGQVREAFRDVPPEAVGSPLSKRRGKLRWPASGRLAARFGSPVAEGKLTLNGIVIAAPEGSPVRAVHAGRVVFADWMRGYGQLLILDHGEGFLTVYGYNETLARAVGDWVKEGDSIAAVGSSGGRSGAGLYFEIRQGGEPVDPARWLRR